MPPWNVVALEPGRALVLEDGGPGEPAHSAWAFVLQEAGPGSTRLIARSRTDYQAGLMSAILRRTVELVGFVMERGIRRRAEAGEH